MSQRLVVMTEFTADTFKQGPTEKRTILKGERLVFLRYTDDGAAIFSKVNELPISSIDDPAEPPGYIVERSVFDDCTRGV